MIKRLDKFKTILLVFILLILCVCLFLVNLLYTSNYAGGKYFISQWTVSRTMITSHENPYSDSMLFRSQLNAYGRPAMAGEYEFRFTYPYFSILLFLPFGLIGNFAIARAAWMLLLEMIMVAVFLLSLDLADWKPKFRILLLLFVFTITYYHTVRAIVDGNPIIVVALILVTILICLRNKNHPIAGILLATSIIEIQYTFVLIVIVLFFALSRRYYQVITYFFGTLFLLIGFSLLLQPDWMGSYFHQLWLSITGLFPSNTIKLLGMTWGTTGIRLGVTFGIIMGLLISFAGFRSRSRGYGYFLWYIFLTVTFLQWSGLPAIADNYFLLVPGFIYGLKYLSDRWKNKGEIIVFLVALSLSFFSWLLFFIYRKSGLEYQEPFTLNFLFPLYVTVILYWVKWWILRKKDFEIG